MRNLHFIGLVCLTCILTAWCDLQAQAEEASTSPSQVVRQWVDAYPHNLSQAVTLTSPDFRKNVSPSEWISQKAPILKNIRLQNLDSQIFHEDINGINAVIKVRVLIDTIVGEQIQVEQYELHRYCSVWLLEQVRVLDERFLGSTM